MMMAQKDRAGDFVIRHDLPADELPKIIERNIAVYEKELLALMKHPAARRCAYCSNHFLARSLEDLLCLVCREVATIMAPHVAKALDAERYERVAELHRSLKPHEEDDEPEEEEA